MTTQMNSLPYNRLRAASTLTSYRITSSCYIRVITLCLLTITIALFVQESQSRHMVAPMHPNQSPINRNKQKQASETQVLLNNKNLFNSMRVQTVRRPANRISFGFDNESPVFKQLNCFFVVVAPKHHGLLLNVNSIGLPKNLTKLTITLNHETNHSQQVHLEGEQKPSQYYVTQDAENSGCPNKRWFDCGDNICVPASLVCDKTPNCPNGNDEMIFYKCYSTLFWSAAGSTGLVVILIMAIVIVLVVYKHKKGLNKTHSLSDNVLTANADGIDSSRFDLSEDGNRSALGEESSTYLKGNLYFNGFENPVWTQNNSKQSKSNEANPESSNVNMNARPSIVSGHRLGLEPSITSASGVHR